MFRKWCFLLLFKHKHSNNLATAELHFCTLTTPHLSTYSVIAILMVSIRWLLTFPLIAVILLPHAAAAFCLVITYFNHSCPSYLTFCFLLLLVLLDCCSLMAFLTYLDLCSLPDPVIPFCQPFFSNFWLLMLSQTFWQWLKNTAHTETQTSLYFYLWKDLDIT